MLAAYSNDILKIGFKAAGLETSGRLSSVPQGNILAFTPGNMPWSHSLFMTVVWALLAAIFAYFIYHDRRAAYVIGLVVVSHWFLDFIVHPPELPLFFTGTPLVGLSLWTTTTGFSFSMLLEAGMIAGGLTLYLIQHQRRTSITPVLSSVSSASEKTETDTANQSE